MADLEGDVEFGEILLILVIFLFIGYLIYKGFGSLADLLKNFHLPKLSDLFCFSGKPGAAGLPCNKTGNATTCDGAIKGCGKIKIELQGQPPATAAGADAGCGGAQANCCTGNCTCN